jgi:hypothetical protein
MKTPNKSDLLCAADWLTSCRGEDRKRLEKVAEWLTDLAERTPKPAASKRRYPVEFENAELGDEG